mgnify:CR=1 FL=1
MTTKKTNAPKAQSKGSKKNDAKTASVETSLKQKNAQYTKCIESWNVYNFDKAHPVYLKSKIGG